MASIEDPAAVQVLRESDPVMAGLIDRYGDPEAVRPRRVAVPADAYGALLRSIVGQQLSTKAARTIYGRMLELFDD